PLTSGSADPLPGSAGTPPASRGRNPGLPTPSPAPPVLPQQAGGEIPACRPPPRLCRYSPSKLGEKSRPADPLPGSAGTPPASWGRNPGLPTPSPASWGKNPGNPGPPQHAGGESPR